MLLGGATKAFLPMYTTTSRPEATRMHMTFEVALATELLFWLVLKENTFWAYGLICRRRPSMGNVLRTDNGEYAATSQLSKVLHP